MSSATYGWVATGIIILAYIPYIISTLKHKTRPNRTTWLVLLLIGALTFVLYREAGALATLGVALANVIGPFVIFLLAIKFGEGWEKLKDFKYLLISLVAVILWQIFDSVIYGLAFNLLADSIAFLPTIRKAIFEPWTEDLLAWSLFSIGNVINLFAIEAWTLNIAIYPLYILLAEGIVAIILLQSRLFRRYPLAEKNTKKDQYRL